MLVPIPRNEKQYSRCILISYVCLRFVFMVFMVDTRVDDCIVLILICPCTYKYFASW